MKKILEKGAMVVVLGTGGVGKTTIAAAIGLMAARSALDTAMITVDPARRLKDALGLRQLGGSPRRISAASMRKAGLDPSLKLSAMVLDVKGAWDGLIERFSTDAEVSARILGNRFYRALAGQFAGSDSYAALEQLYDLHEQGDFDLEVVDTPPAAQALEFVNAPARLVRLLDSGVARWLFTPSAGAAGLAMRFGGLAARFVAAQLESFAGTNVLSSIADFFAAAAGITGAIANRMRKAELLMHSPALRFVLVTTAEEDRLARAHEVIAAMRAAGLRLEGVVINRFLDEHGWAALASGRVARARILDEIADLGRKLAEQPHARGNLSELLDYLNRYGESAARSVERVARFRDRLGPGVEFAIVPNLVMEAGDLRALDRIASYLVSDCAISNLSREAAATAATPVRR